MNIDNLDPKNTPIEYARALVAALEEGEEITLGLTDKAFCAEVVRLVAGLPKAA